MPAATLRQIGQALHTARCALADVTAPEGASPAVHGLASETAANDLRQQIAMLSSGQPVAWEVTSVDPVFCRALDLLRPISVLAGVPGHGIGLTLADDRTRLRDGEPILPRITMPDFAGEVRVDYLAHDGTLAHLYPTRAEPSARLSAQPSRRLAAGERLALGDPGPGKPQWSSGEPYGTDMIVAIASSVPLRLSPKQNAEDKADAYLADLARAVEQARAAGAHVSGAALLVDALPKQN